MPNSGRYVLLKSGNYEVEATAFRDRYFICLVTLSFTPKSNHDRINYTIEFPPIEEAKNSRHGTCTIKQD